MSTMEVMPVAEGQRAMALAIEIVADRVGRLAAEDRESMFRLFRGLGETRDEEEVSSILAAMREILGGKPSGLRPMVAGEEGRGTLARWRAFVSAKVLAARKAAKLTQVQLARRSGLPQSHISRIEAGRLSPSRATLERLAEALERPLVDFDPSGER